MAVQPLTPSDVVSHKQLAMPDEVISSFNELIAQHYINGRAKIKQEDVVILLLSKLMKAHPDKEVTRASIFHNNWLDVEDIYRKAGWSVVYDKPGYNENYAPTFTFERKSK
jgi:hypothetical protein